MPGRRYGGGPPPREVIRGPPIIEERVRELPPRREIIERAPPPPRGREVVYGDSRRGGREQWEEDLLRPQEGITIESVREIFPGDPKYEQYMHGDGFRRREGGGRPIIERGPAREVVREPIYAARPERIIEEPVRRGGGAGWRDNFRGVDYYEEGY